MTTIHQTIETTLPLEEAFDFVADFVNVAAWDPGVASARRVDTGPVRIGSRYRLGIRVAGRVVPMDYVVDAWAPPDRVVLRGTGSGVAAVDDIRFQAVPTGTRIEYMADIRLRGPLALLGPFARGAIERIGRRARDRMQRTLDQRAAAG